jgi:hypothetical protein
MHGDFSLFMCSHRTWNRDWRMEAQVHVLTEESMELEVYLFWAAMPDMLTELNAFSIGICHKGSVM